jgi:hypothetical protein
MKLVYRLATNLRQHLHSRRAGRGRSARPAVCWVRPRLEALEEVLAANALFSPFAVTLALAPARPAPARAATPTPPDPGPEYAPPKVDNSWRLEARATDSGTADVVFAAAADASAASDAVFAGMPVAEPFPEDDGGPARTPPPAAPGAPPLAGPPGRCPSQPLCR